MSEQTRISKEILAHLNGQKDSRASAEDLIAVVTATPREFCAALNALRQQGFVSCAELSEEFVRQGGDASFRNAVLLTAKGQEYYVDLIRQETGGAGT